jgi:hypothetical protein
MRAAALDDEKVKAATAGHHIAKVMVISQRLVNVVVK